MAYIPNTLWPDAAAYGAGLGNTLVQGMMQIPAQRAEQQIQLGQLQQQQQQAMLQQALEQRKLQNQQAAQQELIRYHDILGQAAQMRAGAEQERAKADTTRAGQVKPTMAFSPVLHQGRFVGSFNKETGEWKPFSGGAPAGLPPGVQGPTQPGAAMPSSFQLGGMGDMDMMTQNQYFKNLTDLAKAAGAFGATGMSTNQPAAYGAVTNALAELQRLRGGQAIPPQILGTNPPPVLGGGTPMTQQQGQKILSFNPDTGELQ